LFVGLWLALLTLHDVALIIGAYGGTPVAIRTFGVSVAVLAVTFGWGLHALWSGQ
jgi:hypothetical protein